MSALLHRLMALHPGLVDINDVAAQPAGLSAEAGASITSWADADTDHGFLDGCYCGCSPASPCAPMPAEACTELGAHTPSPTPRLGLLRRAHIALLQRRLDTVRDELDRYEALGAVGPVYQHNSRQQQFELMARIAALKGEPPINPETGEPQ